LVGGGERLSRCARPGDTVARLGGDEFALLLEGRLDRSHLIAENILEAFEEPFLIDGQEMLLRPSVGMAVTSSAEPDLAPEGLVTRADLAMYAAKRSRNSGVLTFSTDMMLVDPDVMEESGTRAGSPASNGASQVRLLGELRHAIDRGDLDVVYQPKLELRTGRVVGVEALLRWPHPQLGVLRPDTFISLVRQQGLMRPVTDLVLEKALDDAARWVLLGAGTSVAVNMFAPFLRDMKLPDRLRSALTDRDLPADMLTVEITEDVVLNELGQVMAVLQGLRDCGIRVAIDDFGSGYSALSYLRDLRIDEVKLDRHFIASVTSHERAAAVVRAVIDLSHELGITVVAEGVEDAETAVWLREHGCDIGQGYYLGMPVAASMVEDLVLATRGKPASLPHEPA
jgi:diguanylate cyclase